MERRLTTILAADVVGYSRCMGTAELLVSGTAVKLRRIPDSGIRISGVGVIVGVLTLSPGFLGTKDLAE